MVHHFNLRSVDFSLMTTDWSELLSHPDLSSASLILLDFNLTNKKENSHFSGIQSKLDLKDSKINGFDIALVCAEVAPDADVKILTANPKLAIQALKSNPEYSKVCDVSDIIQKPLTLKGMANLVANL